MMCSNKNVDLIKNKHTGGGVECGGRQGVWEQYLSWETERHCAAFGG